MTDIKETQNLNAHYTTVTKIKPPKNIVVTAPNNIPKHHLYNDQDANNRINQINNDIYEDSKKVPKKETKKKKFLGLF